MNLENIELQFASLSEAVISGKKDEAVALTGMLLNQNISPDKILEEGLFPGMKEVGKKFKENLIFVPQVLISARAMKSSLSLLEPLLAGKKEIEKGSIIIGTVKGDIHDIGKNIVAMMLKSSGYKVVDLGINITAEQFISSVKKENASLLCLSALLTTTMTYMKTVIERVKSENLNIKILVGGAPLNKRYSDEIGADGFANNAADAVKVAESLLSR